MHEDEWLAERFEEQRNHLSAVALRMLGSPAEADDAVQEAWLRLSRSDVSAVDNLSGWLTTVVSRVCLDMLRTRRRRGETELGDQISEPVIAGPEHEALLADAVGPALQRVLDSLAPAERIAFVLHDLFAVPFDEIAEILGRTPAATRQLASRGRRRIQGGDAPGDPDRARRAEIVAAFLDASRNGNFAGLLAILHPGVLVRADATATAMGAEAEIRGSELVAAAYNGRAQALRRVLINGEPGAVWQLRGEIKVMFAFTVLDGLIATVDLISDPDALAAAEVDYL